MKNTIILAYPRIRFEENYPCSWLPFSVLAIAGALPKDDVDVVIFDGNRRNDAEFETLLHSAERLLCVGFSIMTGGGQIENALVLAEIARQIRPDVPTVFGGPHVNVLAEETLRHPLVDIVISGPGQTSFPPLIKALRGEISFEDIPGVLTSVGSALVRGEVNELSSHTLVPYDFSLVDINDYIQYDVTISERTINYISTQGCVYKCRFCYETNYGRKYGKFPCENVVGDIEKFVRSYGINGIKFYDADWFIDSQRVEKLIDELTGLNISWAASVHPKDILRAVKSERPLMDKLSASHCQRLLMGIESGNDRILNEVVDKGVTKDEMYDVANIIAQHGILGSYTFIVGFPGETMVEQEDTFNYIKALWELSPRPETRVHIYTPYPGTPLYNEALKQGFKPPSDLAGWSNFDYYKASTPWVDSTLEQRVEEFTSMIPKM
jgi:radical SAM superfamily enzyme YgiQ (UPF0313 family)